jgi:broad specificity phosphatase PhoE
MPKFPVVPVLKLPFCFVRCLPRVILVRHADVQPNAGVNPALTAAGIARAQILLDVIGPSGLTSIITSSFQRTQQTAAPTAASLGLTPLVLSTPEEIATNIRTLATTKTVLVVGHTNTIPQVITLLGGPTVSITALEFDRLFVFAGGQLVSLRYGA